MDEKERAILDFLAEFKQCINVGQCRIIRRKDRENRNALIDLDITESMRRDYLLQLSKEDYSQGPLPDDAGVGEVWIFGMDINETETYIKLKVRVCNGKKAICISFHPAEWSLDYPYR